MIKTTTAPTLARWNNTGGDTRVHIVPAGTEVLVDPTQEEVWRFSFQVTTPICGLGTFHGSWTQIDEIRPPLHLCQDCAAGDDGYFEEDDDDTYDEQAFTGSDY